MAPASKGKGRQSSLDSFLTPSPAKRNYEEMSGSTTHQPSADSTPSKSRKKTTTVRGAESISAGPSRSARPSTRSAVGTECKDGSKDGGELTSFTPVQQSLNRAALDSISPSKAKSTYKQSTGSGLDQVSLTPTKSNGKDKVMDMNQQNNEISSTVSLKPTNTQAVLPTQVKNQPAVARVIDGEEKEKAAQLPCCLCGMEDKHNSGLWQSIPDKLKILAGLREGQKFTCSHCSQGIKNLQKDAGQEAAFDDITDSQVQDFIRARRSIRISKEILHATKAYKVEDWIKENGEHCLTCGDHVEDVDKKHREGWQLSCFDVFTCKRCVVLLNEYETKDKQKRLIWLNSRMAAVKEAQHHNLDIKFVLRHDLERCEYAILSQKGICPLCATRVDGRVLENIVERDKAWLPVGTLRVCKSCNSKRDNSARSIVGDAKVKKGIREQWTESKLRGMEPEYKRAQEAQEDDVLKKVVKHQSLDKLSWLGRLIAERLALERGMSVAEPGSREKVYAAIVAALTDPSSQPGDTQANPIELQ